MFLESPDPPSVNDLSPTQQEVLRGLVAGHSISAAARRVGIHRATVHLWIRTVPTFSLALDAHRRLRADRIADDPESPAAVRHKTAIEILNLAQRHEESRLCRDSHLLADLHAELDAAIAPPPKAEPIEKNRNTKSLGRTQRSIPPRFATHPAPAAAASKFKRCCGKIPLHARAA